MTDKYIYLDHAATTPVRKEVLNTMLPYFSTEFANPSSPHTLGIKNREKIESARYDISKILNCNINEVTFTSGGTESNNLAIRGLIKNHTESKPHIIISSIEHHAILDTCEDLYENNQIDLTKISVNHLGQLNLNELENAINKETILISIMYVNNEIGTIQPITEISKIIDKKSKAFNKKIYFHSDAVQAAGYLDLDVKKLGLDMMTLAAHKFNGPKGMGILYHNNKIKLQPINTGGGQEIGLRSGTENLPGIIGTSKALKIADDEKTSNYKTTMKLNQHFISKVTSHPYEAKLHGDPENKIPFIINISFDDLDSELLITNLANNNIFISSGSACSSGSVEPSHVIQATGISRENSWKNIRISIDHNTTIEELDLLLEYLIEIKEKIQ